MEKEYKTRVAGDSSYRRLAPSLSLVPTKSLRVAGLDARTKRRRESLIYEIGMTPKKCRREDPYTGTQFIYDYCHCRNGPTVADRHTNFILKFPKLRKSLWLAKNPKDPTRKSYLWYALADLMIFKDGVLRRSDGFEQDAE
ncbi:Uncharacterised protein [uncultured archaeon]|nr:Uncharacterised protein [uncultured archaeon]